MELCLPFSQFLQEIAVLSKSQSDKISDFLAIEEETQVISTLADFFRSFTPSDWYDLASRLHSLWKKSSKVSPSKRNSVEKLTDFVSEKLQHEGLKSVSDATIQKQHYKKNVKPNPSYVSESESKSSVCHNSLNGSGIFNNELRHRNSMQMENDQKKRKTPAGRNTPQPAASRLQSYRHSFDVFDRLHKDAKKDRQAVNEFKKADNEMKNCTFKPTLIAKKFDSEGNEVPRSPASTQTFDRLYKQYQLKKHFSIENELKRQALELKDCTFRPAVSTRIAENSEEAGERYTKLYSLHSERERKLMRKRMEQSEEEEKLCSFRPQVIASPNTRANSKEVVERLQEWNEIKNVKMEARLKQKVQAEQKKQLDLPARKTNEINYGQPHGLAFDRLYQDQQSKKTKQEQLEKRIMKDTGVSFTPKTNTSRNLSQKKLKESASQGYFLGLPQESLVGTPKAGKEIDINKANYLEGKKSLGKLDFPKYKSNGGDKSSREMDFVNNTEYKKKFLDLVQNNLLRESEKKTLGSGFH